MKYSTLERIYDADEGVSNNRSEKKIQNSHPKLTLVRKIHLTGHPLPSLSQKINEDRSKESKESVDNFTNDSWEEAPSSLSIYLKTIYSFPLLSEEEERIIGERIKTCEEECKHLVIKWQHLFKNKFLPTFSTEDEKTINKEVQGINDSLTLFDNLAALENERRKVKSALQEQKYNVRTRNKLQEDCYKIAGEISRCIAKITLSREHIERTVYNLKEIPPKTHYASNRQSIENDLGRTLEDIRRLSREIKKLKSKLVNANQKLVTDIAKKYSYYGLELLDLIQEGNLGLLRAIDTYDYRRGYRFMTYAIWWIRHAIIRAIQCKLRTIRKPTGMNEKLSKVEKTSERLSHAYKREPTVEEIAEEMNVSLESIEHVVHSFNNTVSLDALTEEGSESEGKGNLSRSHTRNPVLERVVFSSLSKSIDVALSELSQREREVVTLRFGIGGCDHHTLEEIGVKFDFSRERSRQILESALSKMKSSKHITQLKDFADFN